ncbi:MAG: hypothetical protein JSR46_07925 [Verrucomicrobia bacterium]|nr:hypothetical protein [Verrucomicrobiota bacterium]
MESSYCDIKRLFPSLSVKVSRATLKGGSVEEFSLQIAGNTAHIQAASPLAEKFAMSQLLTALHNNRFSDIIGETRPLFANRLLWVNSTQRYALSADLEVSLPSYITSDCTGQIKQIIDQGYNMVVFAAPRRALPAKARKELSFDELQKCLEQIRSMGLKVALELHTPHAEEACSLHTITGRLKGKLDFLLCRQNSRMEKSSSFQKNNPTNQEKLLRELSFFEQQSQIPILYSTTELDEMTLLLLANTVSSKSMISFSASTESGAANWNLHPTFAELSRAPMAVASRLVPLIPLCQYPIREGTWFSDFPLDFVENVLGRQVRDRFCGAGCIVDELSQPGTFAECPLWAIGQRMWRHIPVYANVETWFGRYHPNCKTFALKQFLHQIHSLICSLSLLDSQIQERAFAKTKRTIDRLAFELQVFSEDLQDYRTEMQYYPVDDSLEALSEYMYYFQSYVKKKLETASQAVGSKISLAIQDFSPVNFCV